MKLSLALMAGALLVTAACSEDVRQARGFSLPEGDIEKGQRVFTEMRCNDCHLIGDIAQDAESHTPEFSIKLGGKVARISTHGELVASVINPSHRIARKLEQAGVTDAEGKSRMRNYNDVMTVQELTDLVAFLQSEYELRQYPQIRYRHYYPTD